jgi:hypothetical protein
MQRDNPSSSFKNERRRQEAQAWRGAGIGQNAYTLLHRASVEWAFLSIDVFRESGGTDFPYIIQVVTGSQPGDGQHRRTKVGRPHLNAKRYNIKDSDDNLSWNTSASVIVGLLAECVCGKTRTKSLLRLSQAQPRFSTFQDNAAAPGGLKATRTEQLSSI